MNIQCINTILVYQNEYTFGAIFTQEPNFLCHPSLQPYLNGILIIIVIKDFFKDVLMGKYLKTGLIPLVIFHDQPV